MAPFLVISEWLSGWSGHLGTGRRIDAAPGEELRNLYFPDLKALPELNPTDPN